MYKQEYKIIYDNEYETFYFAHSLKTAKQHAEASIKRNKNKHTMKLYELNNSSYGDKWILIKEVNKVS